MGNNKSATCDCSNKDEKDYAEIPVAQLSLEQLYTLTWAEIVVDKLHLYGMSEASTFRDALITFKGEKRLIKEVEFNFNRYGFIFTDIDGYVDNETYFVSDVSIGRPFKSVEFRIRPRQWTREDKAM